jgi:hypothetical protein
VKPYEGPEPTNVTQRDVAVGDGDGKRDIKRPYIISQGINPGSDSKWGVYEVKLNGSLRRICSKFLPLRETKEQSESDLMDWLTQNPDRWFAYFDAK